MMVFQDQEKVPENLRNLLAVAVRSIQWSYTIFWALSTTQEGVLEWGEGYYNGNIKTRKTVQSRDFDAHRMGLQRSDQLRNLYESLLEGESELGTRRPSGTLSPEDLSDLEWYYLVCMSFTFKLGQSLPGRALETGQHIWLCDAQSADSSVFSRSLLAKSASIQTVICFPHMGGVIELGVTDLVSEDSDLIQHIKTTLLELAKPMCSENYSCAPFNADDEEDNIGAKLTNADLEMVDKTPFSTAHPLGEENDMQNDSHQSVSDDFNIGSPDECSINCCNQTEESLMFDGTTSPFQNWHLIEDNLSQSYTGIHGMVPQSIGLQEGSTLSANWENSTKLHLEDMLDRGGTKFTSQGLRTDNDNHYQKTLSIILKSTDQIVGDQNKSISSSWSSFNQWKKECTAANSMTKVSQKLLKTMLLRIPYMHARSASRTQTEDGKKVYPLRPQSYDPYMQPYTYEQKKRENEQYLILGSMVPSITKIDETSILTDTIEYLQELEARVDELESCIDLEGRSKKRELDLSEQTSDNYERAIDGQKSWTNKRKASVIDEASQDMRKAIHTDIQQFDVEVTVLENEVLIKMRCAWRDYLLLDIMDALNNLNLDIHTVQSSTLNGILSLSLESKFAGVAFVPEAMIKQALGRTIGL